MGARDYWDRMLVYFGIAEEVYDEEPDDRAAEPRSERAARRSSARADAPAERGAPRAARASAPRPRAGAAGSVAGVGIVPPRTFNDAQQIADQLKRGHPVIVDLQSTDGELAKRIIDFASGLTYALDGSMQRVADKVFLLTPPDVEVSAEDRAEMAEHGFFNQS
jgi:cell division inhibitor SepF